MRLNNKENILHFMMTGLLFMAITLNWEIFFVSVIPSQSFGADDASVGMPPVSPMRPLRADERLSRRTPPREAFDACEGKREGDPCSFSFRDGFLEGECHAGVENQFACRPHRGATPPETVQKTVPSDRAEPLRETGKEARTFPGTGRDGGEQAAPSSLSQPSGEPATHEPGAGEYKADSVQSPQTIASPAESGSLMDKMGRHIEWIVICLLIAGAASGFTWYKFFRYYTVPIRRLRSVTQELARGNLSARVGQGLVSRKDEMANLGRDVDRMAERTESLVGAHQRLIRDVSHELRSPLARLNVALELARQSAGPEHAAPFDRIERESERLNELINQLLMLTKLENESGMRERALFDVADLVSEIAQDVNFEAKSNGRSVVVAPSDPVILNGNRELFRQALENLLRNAARYTARGTAVEISLLKRKSGGRVCAHIEIKDHGPGVPESELKNIFRPFYRVNNARERQSGGAGVGLAIADRAVYLHDGSLRAVNAPDGGLIMEMELPLD